VKNKETYSKAKNILEKYGETVTPEVRPSPSTTENANKGMSRRKKRERYIDFNRY
jgi:hypothetical protein